MSESIQISSNAADVIRRWRTLPTEVQGGIVRRLSGVLLVLQGKVRGNAELKFTGGRGGLLSRLTSFARRSEKMGMEAAIGFRKTSGFPYELSQEFGAKAKPGKAIAVPISREAKAFSGAGMGPREFPGLRLQKVGGRAFLVEDAATASNFHYVLVMSLRPRLHFRRTVLGAIGEISEGIVRGAKEGWAKV